jgi:hypothetical protein
MLKKVVFRHRILQWLVTAAGRADFWAPEIAAPLLAFKTCKIDAQKLFYSVVFFRHF